MKRILFVSLILTIMAGSIVFAAQRKPAARPASETCRVWMMHADGGVYWLSSGPLTYENGCFSFDGQLCNYGNPGTYQVKPGTVVAHYRITGEVVVESAK
jgi:hypothetical protein